MKNRNGHISTAGLRGCCQIYHSGEDVFFIFHESVVTSMIKEPFCSLGNEKEHAGMPTCINAP